MYTDYKSLYRQFFIFGVNIYNYVCYYKEIV